MFFYHHLISSIKYLSIAYYIPGAQPTKKQNRQLCTLKKQREKKKIK
jgi:hypothetical protein